METRVDPKTGIAFVHVPAGEFRMGSEADEDSQPVHPVRLAGFWIGRFEVTHAQYDRFMTATGRPAPSHWTSPRFSKAEQPVVGVTYDDAAAFCAWAGGRLPTEAEWEYAARGTDGRLYPWGHEAPDRRRAVFHLDIGFDATMPVGSAPEGASPFGALDMAGNVFEWCADWYDPEYYRTSLRENPTGPSAPLPGTAQRAIRGGAWISLPDACRATARGKYPPGSRSLLVGFRVARLVVPAVTYTSPEVQVKAEQS